MPGSKLSELFEMGELCPTIDTMAFDLEAYVILHVFSSSAPLSSIALMRVLQAEEMADSQASRKHGKARTQAQPSSR